MGLVGLGEPILRKSKLSAGYQRPPSFSNMLPWSEWEAQHQVFAMDDGKNSCGVVLELFPVDAEARPLNQLEQMLDKMAAGFAAMPARLENPWIIQIYANDEPLLGLSLRLRQYAEELGNDDSPFTEDFQKRMEQHFAQISNPSGVFEDSVAGVRWRGRLRRVRLCIYRDFDDYGGWPNSAGRYPPQELNSVVHSLRNGLSSAGVASIRLGPAGLYDWMFAWLNPYPSGYKDAFDFLTQNKLDDTLFRQGYDLSQGVLQNTPRNDHDKFWHFNDKPHYFIPIMGFRREPDIGTLTLENQSAKAQSAALFDKLPDGCSFMTTIVFTPKDQVQSSLGNISKNSGGGTADSVRAHKQAAQCDAALSRGNAMYPTVMGFYLRAHTNNEMEENISQVFSHCQALHIDMLPNDAGMFAHDEYVRYLPMAYKPQYDSRLFRQKLQFLMTTLAFSPLWGKSSGTNHPGLNFFDRSGNPITYDILNKADRDKAAHKIVLGPSGAGKSSTLNYIALQTMALHKPHMYIIDIGDSFRLLGEHFKRQGLKVKYVKLDNGDVPLPPFANSEQMYREAVLGEPPIDGDLKIRRDYLGEMGAAARLIVTGGEEREDNEYRRADKSIVKCAILDAAKKAMDEKRKHATIDDFVAALDSYLDEKNPAIPHGLSSLVATEGRQRLNEIRASAYYFLDGFRGELFNTEGEDWPDADVTIVDLGNIGIIEDYKDVLALSVIGLLNKIQRDSEQRRGSGRQSVVIIDEGHLTTTNPMLAEYITKGTKIWRKWGLWLWIATQNLTDFPDKSAKMLTMAEFWLCLHMPKSEAEAIAKLKSLTKEDLSLLTQARKEPLKYAEGVLLSESDPLLLRIVPPALALALGQTEEHEVAERHQIMKEMGFEDEIDAVYEVEKRMIANRIQE